VKRDTLHLQKHAILAYFVGGKQQAQVVLQLLNALQSEVGTWLGLGRDLGCGFFQIYTKSLVVTQKVLMLTPHRSKWGTCILQTWTPDFNSSKPVGLKVPTWITLRKLRGEFLGVADQIAADLGEVVGSDKRNAYCTDQRFCVALTSGAGYRSQLSVTNECTGLVSIVEVDYGNLPIRCRFCASLEHLIRNCPSTAENKKDAKDKSGTEGGPTASSSNKRASDTVLPPAPPVNSKDNPTIFQSPDLS
jgi:hypothetical protein